MNAVIIGPHIKVNDNGAGFIQCNGRYISNTAYGYNTKNDSKKPDYDYTTDIAPGFGGSASFYTSRVEGFGSAAGKGKNSKYGRPSFKTEKITITLPKVDLTGYAKSSDLNNYVSTKSVYDIEIGNQKQIWIGGKVFIVPSYTAYSNLKNKVNDLQKQINNLPKK